ncbi:MAG: glutaminyl-peptide cyclotransferase [Bacteroidota bacterium]|nr:glutaminyl-peptide cyclotransferase [Bacteroidota bacterium]
MLKKIFAIAIITSFAACNNEDKTSDTPDVPVSNVPAPQPLMYTIDAVYPHDSHAFTQGLEFYNGKLYEGTGELKQSTLRIVDIKTGNVEKRYTIPDADVFGEGITIFKNKIYQLTWQNNKVFVYNINDITNPVKTLSWKLEGWGISNDGNSMMISDGSDKIYYVLPDEEKNTMKELKILSVADNRGKVDSLNELEYINGYIYANRWYTNEIVKIDTSNGHVVGRMDLSGLLHQYAPDAKFNESAVLNGIAYDSTTKKLYITGKDWPKMFELHFNQ